MSKVLRAAGMNKCLGCFACMLVCSAVNRKNHSISKSAIKIRTAGGLQGKMVADVCQACTGERACAEACPSGALENRPGGGVIFKSERCICCRRCEKACIVSAIFYDEDEHKPIICKHCGVCTRFCPHNCLSMEDAADAL